VREVVSAVAINPNTVSKAYRELEHEGLVAARAGVGTFVTASTSDDALARLGPLRHDLEQWLVRARGTGLDDESIEALFRAAFRATAPVAS
jgi:GntR family transcriptional regulator